MDEPTLNTLQTIFPFWTISQSEGEVLERQLVASCDSYTVPGIISLSSPRSIMLRFNNGRLFFPVPLFTTVYISVSVWVMTVVRGVEPTAAAPLMLFLPCINLF